jgi:uncharacterized protein (DUF427 family)
LKAIYNNKVIAQAEKNDLIFIEGNWYFPHDALKQEYFKHSGMHTTCFWKGEASYYDIYVDGKAIEGAAFYYPDTKDGANQRVKKDFSNYVSFWRGVVVSE